MARSLSSEISLHAQQVLLVAGLTDRAPLKTALAREGWTCIEASEGDMVEKLLPMIRIHLIAMDLELPRLDPLPLLRRLRAAPASAKIPIVVLAKVGGAGPAAIEAGADAFLVKPVAPGDLVRAVSRHLTSVFRAP